MENDNVDNRACKTTIIRNQYNILLDNFDGHRRNEKRDRTLGHEIYEGMDKC